jgi:hypothetical protein
MEGSFGWIPHAFIRQRITRTLSSPELLLYFFLCVVADAQGVSFYGEALLTEHLSLDPPALEGARRGLTEKGLILYREGVYPVLPLPAFPAIDSARPGRRAPVRARVRKLLEEIDARSRAAS